MFVGKFFRTLDEKSRLVVPPSFRRELEAEGRQSVILAPDQDGCLMLTRPADFAAKMETLKGDRQTPEGRDRFRYFTANAQLLELDKAGRVTISDDFRRFAGLDIGGEAAIAGYLEWAEIWNADVFREREQRSLTQILAEGRG
ncbi:MAG TPA: hypothetical protein VJR05_09245 [Acidimicrobiia bacterium]|nr:hypothetical protein [Acidimicrobiia bacterium]